MSEETKEKEETNKESSENKADKNKKNLENWLRDKYNLGLVGILVLASIIRLYFYFIAKDQAHWWDSLAFGSLAKNMISHIWDNSPFIANEAIIRPPLLGLVWSFLLRINFSDAASLFFLEIIPSILSILFIYLLAKEIYNKKVALISSFILSVLWIHLFYTTRIMSDVPSLFFTLASLYFFVKSYDDFKLKFFSLAIFFVSLAILTRYFYGFIGVVYIVMVIAKHKHKFISNKNFWIGGILGAIPIIIFFAYNLVVYKGLLPAASVYSASAAEKPSFAYYVLGFIQYDLQWIFVICLALGTILVVFELALGYDSIFKMKKLSSHLMLLLIGVGSLIFFIFILRAAEDRYLFLLMPSLIIFSAIGIEFVYNYSNKYNKILAIILVVIILLLGAYYHLSYGNLIIENKKTSYMQMKEAFLWINKNTPQNAVILGDGIDPYVIYYGERNYLASNSSILDQNIKDSDYVVLHGFEHQTPELINYVTNNSNKFAPAYSNFFDPANQQPAVVIYKIKK
ncbi:MAG: glycosyltransferase family 39 protein [Nanoarchaeota archaeon]